MEKETRTLEYPRLLISPRKYPSKLHKKMLKLEKAFDKAQGRPLIQARLLKAATAVYNKLSGRT